MRARSLLCVLAGAALTGCGMETPTGVRYDRPTVERFLGGEVARTIPDLPVDRVTCPDRLDERVGGGTPCQVLVGGIETIYLVQVLAGRRFEARPEHPIVDLRIVTTQIAEKVGPRATVSCGEAPLAQLRPEAEVVCRIVESGTERSAVVTAGSDGTIRVADR